MSFIWLLSFARSILYARSPHWYAGFLLTLLILDSTTASAQIERPKAPIPGDVALGSKSPSENQLVLEKVELAALVQSLGMNHPEVKSTIKRIAALEENVRNEKKFRDNLTIESAKRQWEAEKNTLDALEKNAPPEHPQIAPIRARILALEEILKGDPRESQTAQKNPYTLQQLAIEKAKYDELIAMVGPSHPQAQSSAMRIAELKLSLNARSSENDSHSPLSQQLALERSALLELRGRYGNSHPLVKSAVSRVEALQASLPKQVESLDASFVAMIRQQLVMEKLKALQHQQTLGDDHPLRKMSITRVKMLEEVLAEKPSRDTTRIEKEPEETDSLIQLRNTYRVDRYLAQRVAKEWRAAQQVERNDSPKLFQIREKLRSVVAASLQSKRAYYSAEIEGLRRQLQQFEESLQFNLDEVDSTLDQEVQNLLSSP